MHRHWDRHVDASVASSSARWGDANLLGAAFAFLRGFLCASGSVYPMGKNVIRCFVTLPARCHLLRPACRWYSVGSSASAPACVCRCTCGMTGPIPQWAFSELAWAFIHLALNLWLLMRFQPSHFILSGSDVSAQHTHITHTYTLTKVANKL